MASNFSDGTESPSKQRAMMAPDLWTRWTSTAPIFTGCKLILGFGLVVTSTTGHKLVPKHSLLQAVRKRCWNNLRGAAEICGTAKGGNCPHLHGHIPAPRSFTNCDMSSGTRRKRIRRENILIKDGRMKLKRASGNLWDFGAPSSSTTLLS